MRYADDFILGFSGPKNEAIEIEKSIKNFINETLRMKVNEEKSSIVHATEPTMFLGTKIMWFRYKRESEVIEGVRRDRKRALNRPNMRVPLQRLYERAVERKYAVWRTEERKVARSTSAR